MKVNMYKWTMVALAGSAAALMGCESQSGGVEYQGTAPHGRPGATYDVKAAPKAASEAPAQKAAAKEETKAPAQAAKTTEAAAAPKAAPTSGTVQYLPTGDRGTSALMIEKIYPTQVTVGQPFDYIIKATNISSMGLSNVTVTEAVPSNFTLASSSVQGANGVYNLGTLNPGESKSIVMKGSAGAVGSINSCASATYATALCSTINVVQPALQITKTITPEAILNCQPINMTVTVKNSGSGTATNVRVMDTLPAGLTLAGGGTSFDEAVGDLAPGASKVITKELKAANTGRFENVASAKADGVASISSEKVATVVKQPKLEIACKAGGKIMMGRKGCYEITIKNTGDAVSQATKIAVTLPAGATVASMSDGGANGAWTIGDLAPGASKTVTVCLTSATIGSLPVSTTVTGTCAAPASTNCAIEVIGVPDIGTLVDDADGVVTVGNNHTYRVVVNNQGQVPLTNVKTLVSLPAGLEFVSSPDGKLVNGKVEFNFGTLAVKGTRTATFIVKASKAGEFLVIGETTCAELKTPIRDDELTNFVEQ
jgi:uncharacterized repeat protein (TIGR01451 family)